MIATVLQLAGLAAVTVGATMQFDAAGLMAGLGAASLYVGVAMDRGS